MTIILNGEPRKIAADPLESLQEVLKRLGIHSVRVSDDGEGFSGSDTILFDDKAVLASLMVAGQADGHRVDTVESLAAGGRLSVIQEALLDAGAVQSAFNIPATALVLEDLLRRISHPNEEDVRDALSGIFNRATGYRQFFLAVDIAVRRMADPAYTTQVAPEFRDDLRVVGKNARRVDGIKLVTGMKAFVEDQVELGSCVLRMVRSPYAHATISRIDVSHAESLPGVVMVITHENCPDVLYSQAGQGYPEPSPYDRRMFAAKVRHVGDRVAAVVAADDEIARRACELIEVEYEPLPPVLDLDAAKAAKGTPVHEDKDIVYQFPIGAKPSENLAAGAADGIGDVDAGFDKADVVLERTYHTGKIQCTPLEPHVVYTRMDGDRLIIHASTQVPWHLRRIVATVLGIAENKIRVIKERIGGGYGSKQDILLEEVCAFVTYTTGRPVFYKYSREEEFTASTTRHPFRVAVKMGARKDGTLTAMFLKAEADTGAYGNHCLTVPMNSAAKSLPLFMCDNVGFDVSSYYTNLPPSGAYQGYGAPQASFAVQMAAAEMADALGMDTMEFIEKNRVREGDVLEILACLGEGRAGSAVRVASCGLGEALEEGRKLIDWGTGIESDDPNLHIGKAGVIIQQGSGLPGIDQACVDVKMLGDGSFMVHSGGADLGTGLDTVLAKIAAEVLHCDMGMVAVLSGDTDNTPFDTGAYASSGTFFTGNAALQAAEDLRSKIIETAALILERAPEGLSVASPGVVTGGDRDVDYGEIARYSQSGEGNGQLIGYASFTTEDNAFPYAAHFCQVAVNSRTGAIEIQKYIAVHDSGTPVNPELALGQIYGGILKSIGHALYEEMIFDGEGRLLTPGLGEYGAPMIQELPGHVDVKMIPTDDPYGPFGSKSVAEISVNGAAPAIAIAVHDAVGVWIRDWPITPEKVMRSLGLLEESR
jgi:putative selenate reductase molybdopterin-binding subunit